MNQKEKFLNIEGDRWFERNSDSFDEKSKVQNDILFDFINRHSDVMPSSVLEIGCSNGWRLNKLREQYGIKGFGIEPSKKAVENGRQQYSGIDLIQGTADNLPYPDNCFDMVLFGFCLTYCDPTDLFKIASEANRVLRNNGVLVIIDFDVLTPYYNIYKYDQSIKCYKMNFNSMFEWHPQYNLVEKVIFGTDDIANADQRETFSFLIKNIDAAFPKNSGGK